MAERLAAQSLHGTDIERRLIAKAQGNMWLKTGGADFEPEGFCCEHDHKWFLEEHNDPSHLVSFFADHTWGLRVSMMYRNLIFVNQVNGGDEWWTVKVLPDGELLPFESITFGPSIARGEFYAYLQRLVDATPEQCRTLRY